MRELQTFIAVALLAGGPCVVSADTLLIQSVQQAAGLERPTKGDSMEQVQTRFGAPRQAYDPVGQPPIARWVYPQFTVYFEGERVIHSVANR